MAVAASSQLRDELRVRQTPESIERYFQISLFVLLVTGFVTLAGTGKLDLFSVAFVLCALAVRALHLARRQQVVIPERWTTILTVLYVLIYATDFFLVSRDFVSATVHLVLFGMVVKVFSVHRERDLLYLGVLSFLMVLAASVLTVDTAFFAAFAVFILAAIATFISFEMRRAARAADQVQSIASNASVRKNRFAAVNLSLSWTSIILALTILAGATVLFFALPRVSGGYLSNYTRGSDPVSGFRDSIQLGQIGRIQQSSQVLMHLQIEGDHSTFDGKLRGTVLSRFDGKTWSDAPRYMNVLTSRFGRYDISKETLGADPYLEQANEHQRPQHMVYRVAMEPTLSNVLFLAKGTLEIQGAFRQIAYDSGQSYINLDGGHPTGTYWAVANASPANPAALRASTGDYSPQFVKRYLQLPARVDPRITELTRRVTANARTNYDKAKAVETYLQTSFGYTLELPVVPPSDPVANFLFERKQGHCEYFASSMAIMLRTIGIPTRVATGFRGGEFNDLTGSYIIRGRDAHAWVEVYFPGQGWGTFDPTAFAPAEDASLMGRLRLYADAMNEFWHEWVVNYDFQHQHALTAAIANHSVDRSTSIREWLAERYQQLLSRVRVAQRSVTERPQAQSQRVIFVVCLLLVIVAWPRIWRFVKARRLAGHPANAPQAAAALWYGRTTRHLARYGWNKHPAQTPQEFVDAIDHRAIQQIVREFTDHYEQARFGNSRSSAVRLPELFARLKAYRRET